jgi:16S rRNA (guanine1516-N2)-methyltransferase
MRPRLIATDAGLGLVDDDAPELSPLVLDLANPRRLTAKDDLIRALGWKAGVRRVVDATAGLGRDACALAAFGFDVVAIERAPRMQALWRDALARYGPPRLRLVENDATRFLEAVAGTDDAPDAVFLDPMYPDVERKALQQRELRLIRTAVSADDGHPDHIAVDSVQQDNAALFAAAMRAARMRVVVKRPRWATPLGGTPTHTWEGASTRFDLYVTKTAPTTPRP